MSLNLAEKVSEDFKKDPLKSGYEGELQRPLTTNSIVGTTVYGLLLMLFAGGVSALFAMLNPPVALIASAVSGFTLIGLWVAMFMSHSTKHDKLFLNIFSVAEGVMLGCLCVGVAHTEFKDTSGSVLVGQAIMATVVIFVACLVSYLKGWLRIEQGSKAQRVLYMCMFGLMIMYVLNFVFTLATGNNVLWGGGIIPLVVGIIALIVASLSLIDDFGNIDSAVQSGATEDYKYRFALALVSGIAWVFIEVLRILVNLASNRS